VDAEAHLLPGGAKGGHHLGDAVLRLGDSHTVAGNNHNAVSVLEQLSRVLNRGLGDGEALGGVWCQRVMEIPVEGGLHTVGGRRSADAAEDDVGERAVHRLALVSARDKLFEATIM
jgi:hypothetical protein